MKILKSLSIVFIIFSILSCDNNTRPEKSKEPLKMIKASSELAPKWILKTPSSKTHAYFVGTANAASILDAKKASSSDAVRQLIEYIGFRATAIVKSKMKSVDSDSLSSFQKEVEEKVQGKGSANVSVEAEDTYYELYSDNSYTLYTLIKCPQTWIAKERERLKELVEQQRNLAKSYLKQADNVLDKGGIAKAVDFELQALEVSGKAAENSDVYEEARNQLILILASLSFKLENTPQFAFEEGGSEPINIGIYSSRVKGRTAGIKLDSWEKEARASLAGKNGVDSDTSGMVYYEVTKTTNADKIEESVSFSLEKFEPLKENDEELYEKLKSMQKNQALSFTLLVRSGVKIIPSTVAAFNVYNNTLRPLEKLRQALSVKMVEQKYNMVTVEIPASIIPNSSDESVVQQKIISYIKEKCPQVKIVYFGFANTNPSVRLALGQIAGVFNPIAGSILEGQSMESMEMRFTLSLIDVQTMKVQDGQNIKASSSGMNTDQALAGVEEEVLKKIVIK
jgi:hypothetical protein